MKRVIILFVVGCATLLGALASQHWGAPLVAPLQVAASDLLFARADGPRLGRRAARDDIVLVLFDLKTAHTMGYEHHYTDDVVLYRTLLRAGARVVFDTRMVATASADEFQKIKPMLEEMLEINDQGGLMRDVWLSSAILTETHPRYGNLIVQNVVNSHPHAIPWVRPRLYPLVYFTGLGPHESAPLTIARRVWGLERPSPEVVGSAMRECGIMSVWHRHMPSLVPPTDIVSAPYPVGTSNVDWHPFGSTSSLVPPVGFWVNYDMLAADFVRHSYSDVLHQASASDFAQKIVLIGFSSDVDPSSDSYEVPCVRGKACAAEVVACAVQTVLDGRTMVEPPRLWSAAVAALVIIGMAFAAGLLRPVSGVLAATGILLAYFGCATVTYRSGWYSDCAVVPAFGLLSAFGGGLHAAWSSVRSRQRIVDMFGRYVPRAVVSQLILKPTVEALALGGIQRNVTVLFADIRGFTTFSEDLPPEDVIRQLNALLQIMVECTFKHEGTLDKFIGDAILVLFNAPLDQTDHVGRAVRTAVEIQQRLKGHATGLSVGIGVHRGEAIVGNVGTPERMEYTAIGSTVNIASRLCDVAKSGEIVVSNDVVQELADAFAWETLAPVTVKGIKQPLNVARLRS